VTRKQNRCYGSPSITRPKQLEALASSRCSKDKFNGREPEAVRNDR
jgi:hypothetical protein